LANISDFEKLEERAIASVACTSPCQLSLTLNAWLHQHQGTVTTDEDLYMPCL
jgi:hypothetical protein